jgi:hypothetical protein
MRTSPETVKRRGTSDAAGVTMAAKWRTKVVEKSFWRSVGLCQCPIAEASGGAGRSNNMSSQPAII